MEPLLSAYTPVFLLFLLITAGIYLGKIRIAGVSLDIAGVLCVALAFGSILQICPTLTVGGIRISLLTYTMQNSMQLFASLGTALFISAVAVSAGTTFFHCFNKRNVFAFAVGVGMSGIGVLLMLFLYRCDPNIELCRLLGILCGALTSTPGLSVVSEAGSTAGAAATIGYTGAYFPGVTLIVFFVQKMMQKAERKTAKAVMPASTDPVSAISGILPIAVTAIAGTLLGALPLPFLGFSLGSSGGMLCAGLAVGHIASGKNRDRRISASSLSVFRNFGLICFFAGSGISAGMRLIENFDIRCLLYGILLTIVPLFSGYGVCRLRFGGDRKAAFSVVCGGMTSTPAVGMMLKKDPSSADLPLYSSAYTGALVTVVLSVRLILILFHFM